VTPNYFPFLKKAVPSYPIELPIFMSRLVSVRVGRTSKDVSIKSSGMSPRPSKNLADQKVSLELSPGITRLNLDLITKKTNKKTGH
jgi:hypothetical protein